MLKQVSEKTAPSQEYDPKAEPVVKIDMSECKKEDQPRMIALVNRLAPNFFRILQMPFTRQRNPPTSSIWQESMA